MKYVALFICLTLLTFFFKSHPLYSQEVKIGNQVWMIKNLDVSTFRNGKPIFYAKNQNEWDDAIRQKLSAYCYYEFDSENGKIFGKLYNQYALADSNGLAPKGFHIPTDTEWFTLINELGGDEIAGKKLKNKEGWKIDGKDGGNGNNKSGFTALPAGAKTGKWLNSIGRRTNFWSIRGYGGFLFFILESESDEVSSASYYSDIRERSEYYALSVRCIKD